MHPIDWRISYTSSEPRGQGRQTRGGAIASFQDLPMYLSVYQYLSCIHVLGTLMHTDVLWGQFFEQTFNYISGLQLH